jgi:DNA-binding response OmpR family regulator
MEQPKSILLIEDNKLTGEFLKTVLRLSGHTVECFRDGKSALDAVLTQSFQVVIADYHIPGMNGADAVKHLRSRLSDAFIIGYSGRMMKDVFLEAGADAFLLKPFQAEELISLIREKTA